MTLSPTPTLKVDLGTPSDRLQSFWKIPLQSEVRCVWYVSKVFSGVNLKMCRQKKKHRKLKLENWWPYNPSIWCFVGMAPQDSYEQAAVKSREQHFKRSGPKDVDSLRPKRQDGGTGLPGLHPGGSTASFRLEKFIRNGSMSPTRLWTGEQHGTKHQLVKNDSFTAPEQGHKYPKWNTGNIFLLQWSLKWS